jgi:hypothetical protein
MRGSKKATTIFIKQKFPHFLGVKEKTGICNKTFQYFFSFVVVV